MNYITFKHKMFDLVCFTINQIYVWQPNFNRNNLTRWIDKGLLVRLRQGLYTFPEYKSNLDYIYYFANRIYKPSYISLHSALSFYGVIPEAVIELTSVTTLKTKSFSNSFGLYSYKKIKNELFFGYDIRNIDDGKALFLAKPEKALLDLLYLYPFYKTADDMKELRLDEDFLYEEFDADLMKEYLSLFKNQSLDKRVSLLINTYDL